MVRPSRDRLQGCVEVDETYLGGAEEGAHGRETEGADSFLRIDLGRISSLLAPPPRARTGRLLQREVPINSVRKCARAPAHVRAGPMVNALGPQGECALVLGHLRARLVGGETAFLDARSAQRVGWKGLAFPHETRNFCPTIDFAITRFSATTCNRRPGPLLDIWTGFLGASRGAHLQPNVFEHTRLAPSRKAVSGRVASRPAYLAGRAPRRAMRGWALGKLFRPKNEFRGWSESAASARKPWRILSIGSIVTRSVSEGFGAIRSDVCPRLRFGLR